MHKAVKQVLHYLSGVDISIPCESDTQKEYHSVSISVDYLIGDNLWDKFEDLKLVFEELKTHGVIVDIVGVDGLPFYYNKKYEYLEFRGTVDTSIFFKWCEENYK